MGGSSGGGGKGGGGMSTSSTSIQPSKQLMALLQPLMASAMPVAQTMFGQTLEAMRTGGTQAKIPLIQQAVQQSKNATSRAMSQTESSLGSQRGTPFGQQILANTRQQGEARTGMIPVQVAQQISGQAPLSLQATGQGVGALAHTGTVTNVSNQPASQTLAQSGSGLKDIFSVGKSIGGSGGGGKGKTSTAGGDSGFDLSNIMSSIGNMTGGTGFD